MAILRAAGCASLFCIIAFAHWPLAGDRKTIKGVMGVFDYMVLNGELVTPSWRGPANIGIKDGRVAVIAPAGVKLEAAASYDARGKLVIPALVDTHVHLRDPGHTHKEDFYTGTAAAAAGGYGTVVAQPNTDPPALDPAGIGRVFELGRERSVVDFAVSAQVTPGNLTSLAQLKEAGALIFDAATCDVPADWLISTGRDFWALFTGAARLGVPVAVYATDAGLVGDFTRTLQEWGRVDPLAWVEARPPVAEAAEVARLSQLARAAGGRILFRQISSAASLAILRAVKLSCPSANISIEVNPHHLFLTADDLARLGPVAKMAPPLRDRETVRALWKGLRDGTVDMIGGDHAPHTWEEKMAGQEDIWQAASGVPTLETALPLMLDAASRGQITVEQIVSLMAEKPARWLNLYPRKGTLAPGSDADLVILDPAASWEIRGKDLLSKCRWTPFEGLRVKGRVERTMVRGRWVYAQGTIMVRPGYGQGILDQEG